MSRAYIPDFPPKQQITLFQLGIALEPAGASGLGAIIDHHSKFRGQKVATILTGGNITANQMKLWLFGKT